MPLGLIEFFSASVWAQDPDPEVKGKRAGHGNGGEER
jgi:hypothetical protein